MLYVVCHFFVCCLLFVVVCDSLCFYHCLLLFVICRRLLFVVVCCFLLFVVCCLLLFVFCRCLLFDSSGSRKCSTLLLFQLFSWHLFLSHCLCLCVCIFVRIWIADIMSFQKMYGLRGPRGLNMVNQVLRMKLAYWSERKKKKEENTRDRSVPDGSDN